MEKRSLTDSFNNAIKGIIYALKNERNLRLHFIVAIFVIFLTLFFDLTKVEFLILILTITFVIVAELFNTVVEHVIDLITDSFHPLARLAKDISAGAVLLSSISSIIVGYIIFFKHGFLGDWKRPIILKIKTIPHYFFFVVLLIVSFFVLLIKSISGKEKFVSGGFPSGHTAFAFSVAALTFFSSDNLLLFILTFILAILIGESRVRLKIHTWKEVIGGAVLGIVITTILFRIFG